MIDENTYELINQYLSGELKGVALDRFKNRLKDDAALQAEVATQHQIIQSIQEARNKELKAYITANTANQGISINRNKLYWALGSAAAITLIVGAFFGIRQMFDSPSGEVATEESSDKNELVEIEDKANNDSSDMNMPIDTQTLAIEGSDINDFTIPPEVEIIEDELAEMDLEEEIAEDQEQTESDMTGPGETSTTGSTDRDNGYKDKNLEQYNVQKDEMLSNKVVAVNTINPDFENYAPERSVEEVTVSSEKKDGGLFGKKKPKSKDADVEVIEKEESGETDDAKGNYDKVVSTRNIEIQYWKSPINYTGYNYNGSQVKLYGVKSSKKLKFTELDNRLYMKMDSRQYYLENNSNYNRMVEVTNPTLLKVLNE